MMIDWVTAKIPFYARGRLHDGQVLNIGRDGEVKYLIDTRLPVVGSHYESIMIRTADIDANGDTTLIELSGNPVKFLQGHNLFGSSDLVNLVYETVLSISATLGLEQPPHVLTALTEGDYTLSRVDINEMYHFRDRAEVLAWLYSAAKASRTRSQGAVTKGSTVYWNKSSKRWSVKAYSKGQETSLRRGGAAHFVLPESLVQYADSALRIELTLKGRELDHMMLKKAALWRTIDESELFHLYVGRIQMSEQKATGDLLTKIKSRPVAATYQLWLDGHDVRQLLPKPTFYRHRTALLEHKIDISVPHHREEQPVANVVPFKTVLQMRVAQVPDWVYGTKLFFEPRKLA